jgi:hypothetical protein
MSDEFARLSHDDAVPTVAVDGNSPRRCLEEDCNMRTPGLATSATSARTQAPQTRAAVLVSLVVLASLNIAHASAASPPKFEMQAALDVVGGREITRGDYVVATGLIGRTDADESPEQRVWRAGNLCVAQTMTSRLEDAPGACSEAIALAVAWPSLRHRQATLAALHANRAVAKWRAGDHAAAEADILRAQAYAPDADAVKANLAAIQARRASFAAGPQAR